MCKAKVRCWDYTLQKALGAVETFTIHLQIGKKHYNLCHIITRWRRHKVLKKQFGSYLSGLLADKPFLKRSDMIYLFSHTWQTDNRRVNISQHSFSLKKARKGAIMQKVLFRKKNLNTLVLQITEANLIIDLMGVWKPQFINNNPLVQKTCTFCKCLI